MAHNIQSPALNQTGETTRACRFCLQVHNFLLMEGWSAFYRKFLRISSIKELWAMTRRDSRIPFWRERGTVRPQMLFAVGVNLWRFTSRQKWESNIVNELPLQAF